MMDQIPPITDPLGRHWDQPSPASILIDDTHALMDRATCEMLSEYSCSIPSGVYEGKMWKRHDGIYDRRFIASGGRPTWLLMWFGPSPDPSKCSINSRRIILLDEE